MHVSTVCIAALVLFSSAVSASPSPAGGLRQSLANRSDTSSQLSRRSPPDGTWVIQPFNVDPKPGYKQLALTSNGVNNAVTVEILKSPPSESQKWQLATDALQKVLPVSDNSLQAAWGASGVVLVASSKAFDWDLSGPDRDHLFTIFDSDHTVAWSSDLEAHSVVTISGVRANNQRWRFTKP